MNNLYKSRPVLDKVVEENKEKNPTLYEQIGVMPMYDTGVILEDEPLRLRGLKSSGISSIHDIKIGTQHLKLNDDIGQVTVDGVSINLPSQIIVFFKTCLAAQYNYCPVYSEAVATFVDEAIHQLPNINLPVKTRVSDTEPATTIQRELNEFYRELLDANAVGYHEVIEAS